MDKVDRAELLLRRQQRRIARKAEEAEAERHAVLAAVHEMTIYTSDVGRRKEQEYTRTLKQLHAGEHVDRDDAALASGAAAVAAARRAVLMKARSRTASLSLQSLLQAKQQAETGRAKGDDALATAELAESILKRQSPAFRAHMARHVAQLAQHADIDAAGNAASTSSSARVAQRQREAAASSAGAAQASASASVRGACG